VYLAMRGITVGLRVSQEAGKHILRDAQDDGASNPPGSGANARRRVQPRKRIFGTVIQSVAEKQWKVRWDKPNYKETPTAYRRRWSTSTRYGGKRRAPGAGPALPTRVIRKITSKPLWMVRLLERR